jgi:hypothetical protein
MSLINGAVKKAAGDFWKNLNAAVFLRKAGEPTCNADERIECFTSHHELAC